MEANRIEFLLQRYFDGQLSPEEKQELEELLLSKPVVRREFWRAARTHGLLRLWGEAEWGRHAATLASTVSTCAKRTWWQKLAGLFRQPWWWGAGVGPAAVVVLLALMPYFHAARANRANSNSSDQGSFTRDPGVAVLKSVADVVWGEGTREYQPGATLLPGWLRLRSGAVQIEFARGARVLLEGPAELNLISADEAHLKQGRLHAQVSPAASGFRITSDTFKLVDRGTEFGCDVPAQGMPEVYVFRGAVELSSQTGRWTDQSVKANQAVAVTSDSLRQIDVKPEAFLSEQDLAAREQSAFRERLANWRNQTKALSEHPGLVLHYTFEDLQQWERTPRNEARQLLPGTDATLIGCNRVQGRWPGKRGVEFSRNDDRIRTHIPGQFKSLTYLAWLRVDSLPNHYTSLAMTESLAVGEVHWSLDKSGNLLLAARKAPPNSPKDWETATAYGAVKPEMAGTWIMLASVYDAAASTVTHYVNGEPVTTKKVAFPSALILGDVEIGNWGVRADDLRRSRLVKAGSVESQRAFKGRMDEFALLSVPLSSGEVRAIYDYGKPAASQSAMARLSRPPQR